MEQLPRTMTQIVTKQLPLLSEMHRLTAELPMEIAQQIAKALNPLDCLGMSLEAILEIHRQATAPIIEETRQALTAEIQHLAHDRIQRALQAFRKVRRVNRQLNVQLREVQAKTGQQQDHIEVLEAELETQKRWTVGAMSVAGTLLLILILKTWMPHL